MKKKDIGRKSVLISLYERPLLRSKVDEAIETGDMTYEEISELCAEYDLDISAASLSRYKAKLEEAREKNVDVIELLDKRRKTGNIIDISDKRKQTPAKQKHDDLYDQSFDTVERVHNDIQFLDDIIQKSFSTLQHIDTTDINHGMRAVEIKSKITGNALQGMSLVGLRELKLRHEAKQNALLQSIMRFVPEEQHEELQKYIEQAEKEFYENLDLSQEDKAITDALRQANIDI